MSVRPGQREKDNSETGGRGPDDLGPRRAVEDDGHTIADMSGVGGPSLLRMRRPGPAREQGPYSAKPQDSRYSQEDSGDGRQDRPWEQADPWTPQERRMYALGALKAALLIGMTFIVGLGAVILLLVLVWT